MVGLTRMQAGYVTAMRRELVEGDPHYFTRALRDRRFDAAVKRGDLTQDDISRIAGRYSDRLLKFRGDTIARTEALSALHAGQYEAMQQAIDAGKVRADMVTKVWSATGDGRTRDTHRAMDGQSQQWQSAFTSPSGAMFRYPQDVSLGAPADEVIGCRCHMTIRVKYL